jgi:hypothetical protein
MDVHQATISVAVMNAQGKLIMECLLETKAATIVEFIQGLQGTLALTFEEGTSAAWLHDLLKPHVSRLMVCDPGKAALLKEGNKSDRIDARKLAEMLRTNQLKPVYHGEHGIRTLKELGRGYLTITKDVTRSMNRINFAFKIFSLSPRKESNTWKSTERQGTCSARRQLRGVALPAMGPLIRQQVRIQARSDGRTVELQGNTGKTRVAAVKCCVVNPSAQFFIMPQGTSYL